MTLYEKVKQKYDKPKPILFNTKMVRAILDGRKTQTRRPVKDQVDKDGMWGYAISTPKNSISFRRKGKEWYYKLPYQPEDILYVRETFAVGEVDYGEEPDGRAVPYISQCEGENNIIPKEWAIRNDIGIEEVRWKPSIHMPKKLARIFLKVTDISVERVQEITPLDASKEGVDSILLDSDHPLYHKVYELYGKWDEEEQTMYAGNVDVFATVWNEIYKEKGYGWEENPWVWVIEFERIERDDINE